MQIEKSPQISQNKVVLITGAAGQCGMYMIEFLLKKQQYTIHALIRRSTLRKEELELMAQQNSKIEIHEGDITEKSYMTRLIQTIQPDEIYNYAAQSHVKYSEDLPKVTFKTNFKGFKNICDAVIEAQLSKKCKILQCSTSEMYGNSIVTKEFLTEEDPFEPCSPYGFSKVQAYEASVSYRKEGLQVYNSICFNHESPRRTADFVSRKITIAISRMALGLQKCLELGNINAKRDWSHARDVVRAQWMILNSELEPQDFIVSSGKSWSIKQFVDQALKLAGYQNFTWIGEGLQTQCIDDKGEPIVKINPKFFRKIDIGNLVGKSEKLNRLTAWSPQVSFDDLVKEMFDYDYNQESLNFFKSQKITTFQDKNKTQLQCYNEPQKASGCSWKYSVSKPFITQQSAEDVIDVLQKSEISSKCNQTMIFEKHLQEVFQVPSSVSCSNGYSALVIALKAARIGQGSLVLIPSGTMVAVANAVIDVGAIPIPVDNSSIYSLNPTAQEYKQIFMRSHYHQINIKALIVTHTYGVPAELVEIIRFAKENDIILIEDIAEAVGSTYHGQLVGTFGDFATASLYANKMLTSGDGGFVISKHKTFNNENVQSLFQTFTNHGFTDSFHFLHKEQTGNYRISGLSAAFAMRLPNQLNIFTKKRQDIYSWYMNHLEPVKKYFELHPGNQQDPSVPWVYSVILKENVQFSAKEIRQHLCNDLIETRSFFYPIHEQPFYRKKYSSLLDYELPNCNYQYEKGFYLPCYHDLNEEDVQYICNVLKQFFSDTKTLVKSKIKNTQENEISFLELDESTINVDRAILNKAISILSQNHNSFHSRQIFEGEFMKLSQIFMEHICNKFYRHERLELGKANEQLIFNLYNEKSKIPTELQLFLDIFYQYQKSERTQIQRNLRNIQFQNVALSDNIKVIPTSSSQETIQFIKWLGCTQKFTPDSVFIDMGCFFGINSAAFAEGLESRLDYNSIEIFAIDNFQTQKHHYEKYNPFKIFDEDRHQIMKSEKYINLMKQKINFIKRTNITPVEYHITLQKEKDNEFLSKLLGKKRIAILFFDLNFNEEQIKNFFDSCDPFLENNAIIIFQQYGNLGSTGLRRYLLTNKERFEIYIKLESGPRAYKYISQNKIYKISCPQAPLLTGIDEIKSIISQDHYSRNKSVFRGNQLNSPVIIKKMQHETFNDLQSNEFSIVKDQLSRNIFIVEKEIQDKLQNFEEQQLNSQQQVDLIQKLTDLHKQKSMKFDYDWPIVEETCDKQSLIYFLQQALNFIQPIAIQLFLDEKQVLVHGNLKPYNILIQQEQVLIIDYEHIHLNFAAFDFVQISCIKSFKESQDLQNLYCKKTNRDRKIFSQQVSALRVLKIIKELKQLKEKAMSIQLRDKILQKMTQIIVIATIEFEQECIQLFQIYEKFVNYAYSHIHNTFDKKFNVYDFEPFPKNQGWIYVNKLLREHLHSENSDFIFISAIEQFVRDYKQYSVNFQKWAGFLHQVPTEYDYRSEENLFDQSKILQNCVSLYTLAPNITRYTEKYVSQNQIVHQITYSATPPQKQFNIKKYFAQKPKNLVQIGEYLRDTQFFLNLSVPCGYQKIIQSPSLRDQDIIDSIEITDHSKIVKYNQNHLSNEEYEEFLTTSVVCMKLLDAGGCTTVIDCISRNVPIIINRHESLIEFLGKDYPLFYDDESQLQGLLTEQSLMLGYEFLTKQNKNKFFGEHFLEQITSSGFYRTLKLPLSASMHTEFKSLPLTILINSFKRVANIRIILQSLSSQTNYDSNQVQVIIWNNNDIEQNLLYLYKEEFQSKFYRLEVITSSQNYYCISRSAVSHLALGELFLVVDDDIKPQKNFLNHMIDNYKRIENQKNNKNLVVCLRGNVFLNPNCDQKEQLTIPEDQQFNWFLDKFESKMQFFNQSSEELDIHLVHADIMLTSTVLMKQISSFEMPQKDFALVDDYWYSFVAAYHLGASLVKIEGSDIIEIFPDAEDYEIALHQNSKVLNAKISLYFYHMNLGWPFRIKQMSASSHIIQKQVIAENQQSMIEFIENKISIPSPIFEGISIDTCKLNYWRKGFFGANIQLNLSTQAQKAALNYGLHIFRIGAVNRGEEFPNFIEQKNSKFYFIINREKIGTIESYVQKMLRLNIKIIITMNQLPSRKENSNISEHQFWKSEQMKLEFAKFWQQLALILSRYSNIIGYDLINEPQPDSADDLVSFYDMAIKEIRKVDSKTPIILSIKDGEQLEYINSLKQFSNDESLIFTFNFYQPRRLTQNRLTYKGFQYPGKIPVEVSLEKNYIKQLEDWNINMIRQKLDPIVNFTKDNNVQHWRIFIGEYGVRRDAKGSVKYLEDLVSVIKSLKFSSCFYAFREQFWNAMDYECGLSLSNSKRQGVQSPFKSILFNQEQISSNDQFSSPLKLILEDASLQNEDRLEPWDLEYGPSAFSLRGSETNGSVRQILFDLPTNAIDFQPVFIVGCARSGTTLLLQILANYDQIFALNEPRELWFNALPQLDIWSEKSLQRSGKLYFDQKSVDSIPEGQIIHLREIFTAVLSQTHQQYLRNCLSTPIFVEKTPENLFRMLLLKRIFPGCKFIATVRNRYEIVKSINCFDQNDWFGHKFSKLNQIKAFLQERSNFDSEENLMSNAEMEYEACRLILEESVKNESILSVEYDQLMKSSARETVLTQIEQFLDLPNGSQKPRLWCKKHIDVRQKK